MQGYLLGYKYSIFYHHLAVNPDWGSGQLGKSIHFHLTLEIHLKVKIRDQKVPFQAKSQELREASEYSSVLKAEFFCLVMFCFCFFHLFSHSTSWELEVEELMCMTKVVEV